jgi:hypothetical protein
VLLVGTATVIWSGCSSSHRTAVAPTTSTTTAASTNSGASTNQAPSTTQAPATDNPCTTNTTANTGPESAPPGDIPDTQAFIAFQNPTSGYSIKVPEGWARAEQTGAVTFTDKFNSIRIEVTPAPTAPTAASAPAELSGKAQCVQPSSITTVTRQAGAAVLIKYKADSPPNPVTGKVVREDVERYEFWKAGNEAIVTLASPQGSDNVDPWRKVTDSFAWLR